jgi:hypothetical protein
MSAWAELVNSDGSDEHLKLCDRALKEVQKEALGRLLRNLEEVRQQQRQQGVVEGLDIAIGAIKRRIR